MKKIFSLLLTVVILLSLTACGSSENAEYQDDDQVVGKENIDNDDVAGNDSGSKTSEITEGLLFTTEYTVEDYVENAIIVSKNDGLLYGVLDNKGNEVIPVQYDDIELLNKDEYIESESDMVYIRAQYEDMQYVFDIFGNKVLEVNSPVDTKNTNRTLKYIRFYMDVNVTENTPVFSLMSEDGSYKLYNQKGEQLEITIPQKEGSLYFINEIYYVGYALDTVTIWNIKGDEIYHKDGIIVGYPIVCGQQRCLVSVFDGNCVQTVCLDAGGTILETPDFNVASLSDLKDPSSEWSIYINQFNTQDEDVETFKYYDSNSTLKMEDLDGNPLYAERYFDELHLGNENDCYFLTDENDSVCIFSRNGELYVEFGVLTSEPDDNIMYLITDSTNKKVDEVYEGKKSIIIPISSSNGGYDIYYYDAN